ncbi:hypothetical protein BGX26_001212 [Mortierella sp. AD094]|nr:hypothetical protein BGX26_001212 [Mortierella sp. AD094]
MTNTHTNMPETAQNLNVEPSSARVASQDLHQSMSTPDSLSSGEVVNNDARTIAHSEKFNPETNIKETVPDSSPLNSDGNSEPVEKMLCLATSNDNSIDRIAYSDSESLLAMSQHSYSKHLDFV